MHDFVSLSKAKRYLRPLIKSLLKLTAKVSVNHAEQIGDILQEEKTLSESSLMNDSFSYDHD